MNWKIVLAVVVVVALGATGFFLSTNQQVEVYENVLVETPTPPIEEVLLNSPASSVNRDGFPPGFFDELPLVPSDFNYYKTMFHYGKLPDARDLPEAYWKQPEFFQKTWLDGGRDRTLEWFTKRLEISRYGAYGITVEPAIAYNLRAEPGDEFYGTVFIMSSVKVENWQGVRLSVFYPQQTAISQITGEDEFKQDSNIASKAISVQVSPEQFLLEPAFKTSKRTCTGYGCPFYDIDPVMSLGWNEKITLKFKVSEDAEPGIYVAALKTLKPTDEFNVKYGEPNGELLHAYSTNAVGFQTDPPLYTVIIKVV